MSFESSIVLMVMGSILGILQVIIAFFFKNTLQSIQTSIEMLRSTDIELSNKINQIQLKEAENYAKREERLGNINNSFSKEMSSIRQEFVREFASLREDITRDIRDIVREMDTKANRNDDG